MKAIAESIVGTELEILRNCCIYRTIDVKVVLYPLCSSQPQLVIFDLVIVSTTIYTLVSLNLEIYICYKSKEVQII